MTKYEVMFIVKANLEEDQIKKEAENVKKLIDGKDSKVIEFKEMGRKKLAYSINKELSGYYFVMTVETNNANIAEFDRKVRINENILRHLVVKLESE